MRLIYIPEDGEKREFSFYPRKLMSPEVEALEQCGVTDPTGLKGGNAWDSYDEWAMKFMKGNRRAYRTALWLMLKREEPTLKFRDLVVRVDEIEVEPEDDENQQTRQAIVDEPSLDEDTRESLLEMMDREEDPKATQPNAAPTAST